jgi:DNA processing protein
LKECPDAPAGLYIRSVTPPEELWLPSRSIAVIGTRDISPYGKEWCTKTVSALASAQEKPLIVSGLALGTDICAHKTALESGLPTIGVMATGPETVYPFRHRDFAEKLWRTPGCALISDYPPGTAPLALYFLRRNRIIAGICDTTILIESKIKGGGMMTSRLAFSYSRDVYALPGRIDDPRSQGCNMLIKEKMAEPIVSAENLAESLGLGIVRKSRQKSDREMLSERFGDHADETEIFQMEKIISVIRKNRDIFLDELGDMMQMDQSAVISLTGLLEMEGFIHIDMLRRCSICSKR